MATNEDRKNSVTWNNTDSIRKDRSNNAKSDKNKGNGSNNNNTSLPIDRLPDRVKQKRREVEQLAINADDILEELEKRQPLCQEGE
jgi:hypothetical protein